MDGRCRYVGRFNDENIRKIIVSTVLYFIVSTVLVNQE